MTQMLINDQTNRQVNIKRPPIRIISLVPSITELLFDLGLGSRIVGITRFCIFPATAKKEKKIIGGTKNLKLEAIRSLKPDLIIADKEENTKEQIEELTQEFPVWISNIRQFDDALAMIQAIGNLTDTSWLAQNLVSKIQDAFAKIAPGPKAISVAYFIWQKPLMVAGSDTFIHEMLKKARFSNAFHHQTRYPEITATILQKVKPDVIFLSSEPYPFSDKDRSFFRKILPNTPIVLVDGTYFSWYGSRMLAAAQYFKALRPNSLLNT